jgi:para-nitrobenzyl esterase
VVTINHRLNQFGYINLGDKDERFVDAGNAGMLDMVATLR